MFVINSGLGNTDCSGCRIFRRGTVLFAKPVHEPNFVSLATKIAEMPNVAAAKEALRRIQYAIKIDEDCVDFTDLEEDETPFPHKTDETDCKET